MGNTHERAWTSFYFTLLVSLRVQSKKRPRQAAAGGNQEEEQGKRRKKQVKDSGLEITRLDVEEVSTFRTGLQPWSLVHHCLNIWPSCHILGLGNSAFVSPYVCGQSSVGSVPHCWEHTCSPTDWHVLFTDLGQWNIDPWQHLSPFVSCWWSMSVLLWPGRAVCNGNLALRSCSSWNRAKLVLTGRSQATPKYFSALNCSQIG